MGGFERRRQGYRVEMNTRTDLADCCTKQRAPGHRRGLLRVQQGCCLPADLEAVSGTKAAATTSPVETTLTQSEPLPL